MMRAIFFAITVSLCSFPQADPSDDLLRYVATAGGHRPLVHLDTFLDRDVPSTEAAHKINHVRTVAQRIEAGTDFMKENPSVIGRAMAKVPIDDTNALEPFQ